jgi:hypothetical protein
VPALIKHNTIGSGVLLFGDYGRDFIAVDRCLDVGKVYDYREGRCRDDVTHLPYVPYAERRPALLAAVRYQGDRIARGKHELKWGITLRPA